jgi:hypothetical protein
VLSDWLCYACSTIWHEVTACCVLCAAVLCAAVLCAAVLCAAVLCAGFLLRLVRLCTLMQWRQMHQGGPGPLHLAAWGVSQVRCEGVEGVAREVYRVWEWFWPRLCWVQHGGRVWRQAAHAGLTGANAGSGSLLNPHLSCAF